MKREPPPGGLCESLSRELAEYERGAQERARAAKKAARGDILPALAYPLLIAALVISGVWEHGGWRSADWVVHIQLILLLAAALGAHLALLRCDRGAGSKAAAAEALCAQVKKQCAAQRRQRRAEREAGVYAHERWADALTQLAGETRRAEEILLLHQAREVSPKRLLPWAAALLGAAYLAFLLPLLAEGADWGLGNWAAALLLTALAVTLACAELLRLHGEKRRERLRDELLFCVRNISLTVSAQRRAEAENARAPRLWFAAADIGHGPNCAERVFDIRDGAGADALLAGIEAEMDARMEAFTAIGKESYTEYCRAEETGVAQYTAIPRLYVLADTQGSALAQGERHARLLLLCPTAQRCGITLFTAKERDGI